MFRVANRRSWRAPLRRRLHLRTRRRVFLQLLRDPGQSHGCPPAAPIAALFFKTASNFVTARSTSTVLQVPVAELVPIALDQEFAATRTPRAPALGVVHVSGVNIVQRF